MPRTTSYRTVWWNDKQLITNSIPELKPGMLMINEDYPYMVEILCACGCGVKFSLFVNEADVGKHVAVWKFYDKDNVPTLGPSIHHLTGCCSHFWITKGQVEWAQEPKSFNSSKL